MRFQPGKSGRISPKARKRRKDSRQTHEKDASNRSVPGSIPVPGVVFGVPPKNRLGETPTRTRETRVLRA